MSMAIREKITLGQAKVVSLARCVMHPTRGEDTF